MAAVEGEADAGVLALIDGDDVEMCSSAWRGSCAGGGFSPAGCSTCVSWTSAALGGMNGGVIIASWNDGGG